MFLSLLPPLDFQVVTADILFLLILVELFRLLIIYLQEKRVWLPPTFEGIDPEKRLSMRRKLERELWHSEASEIPEKFVETIHSSQQEPQ